VALNGVLIHENAVLTGPTRSAAFADEKATGPYMIQGGHGPVAFRNIQYAMPDEFKINFTYGEEVITTTQLFEGY
jgi:hypothetical protein